MLTDLKCILPEIVLAFGALCIIVADSFVGLKQRTPVMVSLLFLSAALLFLSTTSPSAESLFFGMLVYDSFAAFFKIIFIFVMLAVVLISADYPEIPHAIRAEFYSFLLMIASAMMLLVGAKNLLMIYLGIEFVSLISYVLAAYWRGNLKSSEAGLKYFLFGTACSITMLYGISIVYGLVGSLDLVQVSYYLSHSHSNSIIISAGVLMVAVGLAFKMAVVPVHFWCPDVYEGAPTPVTAFFSVGPKLAGFAVFLRFLLAGGSFFHQHGVLLLGVLSILTMLIGNITAIAQTNIKRLMAYSSIAHAGYALIGLVVGGSMGMASLCIYLLTYMIMNIGAFAVIIAVSNKIKSDTIKDYSGLSLNAPYLAALLSIFLVSLAGIPPLAGFVGKFYIFSAAIKEGYNYLAIAAVINSVIAAYYYFNIIRVMYLAAPSGGVAINVSPSLNLVLILALFFVLFIGIYPKPAIDFVSSALIVYH